MVDLQGQSAGFTGNATTAWTGDVQGEIDGITWSAQGNILTSGAVVSQTVAASRRRPAICHSG